MDTLLHRAANDMAVDHDETCRLCGGATRAHFGGRVLGRYSCQYLLCAECGSLQSERPYWLDEAYATGHLAAIDTGPVLRCQNNLAVVAACARLLGLPRRPRIVDFGGGDGLLCRMLRDIGLDARVSDRYAANTLARGFDDDRATPDMVCAFEVAEHFADPAAGMAEILGRGAAVCLVGTETYRGQGADWWYLTPLSGQHVFFYSPAGMAILAKRHGYRYERIGAYHLFLRAPPAGWRSALLWRALSERWRPWLRAWLALRLSGRFADADARAIAGA
jgi:hypothetical protein